MTEDDITFNPSVKTKVFLIIFVLLMAGIIIGFLMGGKFTQDRWEIFHEMELNKVEKYCNCN